MAFLFPRKMAKAAAGGAVLLGAMAGVRGQVTQNLPEIRYVRERLDNGLTVIYHQDHRLPLVTLNTWFYVGSKDEPPGRSGFAHLFEHLLFMGTVRVPIGEFDRIIEGAGGSNNASTSMDRTNYFESGPSNLLEMLIYLEADRMEGFGRGIDQEKLEAQRRVVRNERRQSYENRPYGKAHLERWKLLYPPGHPYREPVIGSHEDLERAAVADVKDFFRKFYVPTNASLVVAGDFDLEKAKDLVRKYYGKIPAGAAPPHAKPVPAKLEKEERVTLEDRVQLARVSFLYHAPPIYAEGDADLDIAAAVLGDGKSSRLYRSLVYDKKIAQDVNAAQVSQTLASLFEIQVTARPGQDLDEIEKAVDAEVARFLEVPPTPAELDRARNGYEMAFWNRIEPLVGRADLLNNYQFQFGEPDGIARDLGRYWKVTPESVQKWAREILGKKERLVLRVVPEGKGPPGAPAKKEGAAAAEKAPAAEKSAEKSAEKTADAAAPAAPAGSEPAPSEDLLPPRPPAPEGPPPFDPPVPATRRLECGVPLWVLESRQVPIVALSLIVNGAGAAGDPPGKQGLASIAANMLDEGAGGRGALELADEIDILGATLFPTATRERGELRLVVLQRNLDRALDLFADILLRPRFEAKEWDRVKALMVNELLQRRDNPAAVSRIVADRTFFGDGSPYAAPVAGYVDTVRSIGIDEAREFYRSRWRPEGAFIVAAGDIGADEIQAKLEERLKGWKAEESGLRPIAGAQPSLEQRLVVVDKPGAPQTVISIDMPGRARTDPIYPDLLLANTIFGGSFTSRLNQNLREEHEFTYGARSEFHRYLGKGAYFIQTSVKTDVTGEALVEILREIRGMEKGLRDGELAKASSSAQTAAVEAFSAVAGSADLLGQVGSAGLPPDEPRRVIEKVRTASPAAIQKAAAEVIRWDQATVVLVGDRGAIEKEIDEAEKAMEEQKLSGDGIGPALPKPIFLDAEGRPLPKEGAK